MTEKSENEVDRLIACYTDIKTRNGYASPYEAMNVLCGHYNCILYDSFVGMEGAFVVNVREHFSSAHSFFLKRN